MIAGLTLPPVFAQFGWPGVIGLSLSLVVATILLVQPVRDEIDGQASSRPPLRPAAILSPATFLTPLRAVFSAPGLPRLAAAGCCLAVGHGIWLAFLVTYLNRELHWTLVQAGQVFSVMQATGVIGRIAAGWLSDRLGSGRIVLRAVGLLSGLTTLLLGLVAPQSNFPALMLISALGGLTVSCWNGVQIAEIAKAAPPDKIAAAAAGGTILVFAGFVVGPAAFAALLSLTGSYSLGFTLTALVTALAFLVLPLRDNKAG